MYGTGNNGYTNTGQCIYGDIVAYAARLDYAVAANLNVFTSLIHAQRASATGTPQGLYNGSWAPGVLTNQASSPGNGGGIGGTPSTDVPTPNVPVTDLGWELDAGFHWKILEGVTWKTLFACWQPGAWFRVGVPGLDHFCSDQRELRCRESKQIDKRNHGSAEQHT